ncbi:unnamed protein product [Prunus brigantina]
MCYTLINPLFDLDANHLIHFKLSLFSLFSTSSDIQTILYKKTSLNIIQ